MFSVDNDEQSRLERHGVAFAGLEAIAAGEAFDAGDRVVEGTALAEIDRAD
ncbi:hypothetical protein CEV34_0844 [Brucella pseudogrignonensis]|uniref:Uncharacterized protein n=1 Tax=Brucella pseudogrignonensis TaxID=419475 RepID=A0A256GNM1_9HYPH|nr:hypothetical protein CEV34_0844 [Brucella pseudogrignonensis]